MLETLIEQCSSGLIERRSLVEAIVLAAVAGEHVLVIGPPGTAKSEAARRVAGSLGGRYFEYLLGKFSEPAELFGPVDLRLLKDGVFQTVTTGMLPEAEIAFLDEVFAGSTAILNTLLGVLNERVFRRGSTALPCPLRVCIGASNALPEDESLAAFADRFLVRCFVEPVSDPLLEQLLEGGRQPFQGGGHSWAELDEVGRRARQVDLGPVRPLLGRCLRRLRAAGVGLSDRRSVRLQNLVAAAAALAGRAQAGEADLWPLILAVPDAPAQQVARRCLTEELERSDNPALRQLVEETTAAAGVRCRRLLEEGGRLLELHAGEERSLRIEGVLREIDVHFAPEALPSELAELRARLVAALA